MKYFVEEWDCFQGGWWLIKSFECYFDAFKYYKFLRLENPFDDYRIVSLFCTNKKED